MFAPLLVVALLSAGQLIADPSGPIFTNPATMSAGELFRAMPANGAGLPYATSSFCSDFASTLQSGTNYFCYQGDGTQTSSSAPYALTAVGSPTTVTRRVCPNGPDCGPMTGLKLNGTSQYLQNSAATSPTGSFSMCALFRVDGGGSYGLMGKDSGGAGGRSTDLVLFTGGTLAFEVFKAGGTITTISTPASTIQQGAVHFACGTYRFVSDGTSVSNIYVDGGAAKATNASAVGPIASTATAFSLGSRAAASSPMPGQIYGGFFVDGVELSQAQIQAMTGALLPPVKGTRGEAITTTRASVATCTAPADGDGDGAFDVSVLPNNRPCVTCLGGACGLYTEPTSTNLLLQSGFAATWAPLRATLVQSSSQTAPDGTFAYKFTEDSTAANNHVVTQTVTKAAAAIQYVFSVYARPAGRSTIILKGWNAALTGGSTVTCGLSGAGSISGAANTGSFTGAVGAVEQVGTSFYRCRIAFTSDTDTSILPQIRLSDGSSDTYTGDGASGVFLGCSQLESNGTVIATTCIPTTTAAVPRAGTLFSPPLPSALSTAEGCFRIRVTPIWTGSNPAAAGVFASANTSNTARFAYVNASSTSLSAFDGTNAPGVVANFTANVPRDYRTTWSASANQIRVFNDTDGSAGSASVFSGYPAFTGLYLGAFSNGNNQPIGAVLSNIVLGTSATGCQR